MNDNFLHWKAAEKQLLVLFKKIQHLNWKVWWLYLLINYYWRFLKWLENIMCVFNFSTMDSRSSIPVTCITAGLQMFIVLNIIIVSTFTFSFNVFDDSWAVFCDGTVLVLIRMFWDPINDGLIRHSELLLLQELMLLQLGLWSEHLYYKPLLCEGHWSPFLSWNGHDFGGWCAWSGSSWSATNWTNT